MGIFEDNIQAESIGDENLGTVGHGYFDLRWGVDLQPYEVYFHNYHTERCVADYYVVAESRRHAIEIGLALCERDGHQIDKESDHADVDEVEWIDVMGENPAEIIALELAYIAGRTPD